MGPPVPIESMRFESILFPPGREVPWAAEAPDCFRDLNLGPVVAAITGGWPDYELAPFFHTPLRDADAILYRQAVMRDLETPAAAGPVAEFTRAMRVMRERLAFGDKLRCAPERERWFLAAVEAYADGVRNLAAGLRQVPLASAGMRALNDYLARYAESTTFHSLATTAAQLRARLAQVRYELVIGDDKVVVQRPSGAGDYTRTVQATFAKFRRDGAKDYRVTFDDSPGLNHVEAQVLKRVARLNPEVFGALREFAADRASFRDATLVRFDREVQFYVAYLAHVARLQRAGMSFCYPSVSRDSKALALRGAFDVALATDLAAEQRTVVCNDIELRDGERILVVTGPNQGGKTTFARMVGQLHYLASLGGMVPGAEARVHLVDRVLTHFEREERVESLRGRLQDELLRMRRTLEQASGDSLLVINEMFSSTTLADAVFLSREIMARIAALDAIAVCVTFLDEIATFDARTVSMVGVFDAERPAVPNYRFERRPPDGLAYALQIAEMHGVTGRQLLERLPP